MTDFVSRKQLVVLFAWLSAAGRMDAQIADNSFLIEEAYNQEPGVVQHINAFSRANGTGNWLYAFTQEWPVFSQMHQFSYTLGYSSLNAGVCPGPRRSTAGFLHQ